jgi:hypothetical protein
MLKLIIEIPSLDRLLDYLEGREISTLTAEIIRLTAKLATSESTLKESIQNGQLR